MKITKISIRKFDSKRTKAFVTVELDEAIVITGITVVSGKHGLFTSFPQYKGKDGNYYSWFYAVGEFKDKLERAILKKYDELEEDD